LPYRVVCLAVLFAAELVAMTLLLDTQSIDGKPGLVGLLADDGPMVLQALVAFCALFVGFGYLRGKEQLQQLSADLADRPLQSQYSLLHLSAMAVLAFLTFQLFHGRISGNAVVVVCGLTGSLGVFAGVLTFVPFKFVAAVFRATGLAWLYALIAAGAIALLVPASRLLWHPAANLTFGIVARILSLFISDVVLDPATRTVGTGVFSVSIAPGCSGLEGLGLMTVFSLSWLWISRREVVILRALAVIPILIALMFPLNVLRIIALILIGNAGAESVALGGFHSQAGWIVFNLVALGFAFGASRIPWLLKPAPATQVGLVGDSSSVISRANTRGVADSTAAYLVPFLAILAAGMLSSATKGDFEWLYPMRFVAAAGALFYFREEYRKMDWRLGWVAMAIGAAVFGIWIAFDAFLGKPVNDLMPASLAAANAGTRVGWIMVRAIASSLTVPIAEELAFRGYLLRRFVSSDFTSVGFSKLSWIAVPLSSILFGAMHGDRWIAGCIAGLLYWLAARSKNRIGEAVAAHAITNAMIAVWVVWGNHWSLW
jgi:exosortase E/protease (VPEID-CTERM system)